MGCLGPRHFDGQERSSKHFLLTREILLVVLGVCLGCWCLDLNPLTNQGSRDWRVVRAAAGTGSDCAGWLPKRVKIVRRVETEDLK